MLENTFVRWLRDYTVALGYYFSESHDWKFIADATYRGRIAIGGGAGLVGGMSGLTGPVVIVFYRSRLGVAMRAVAFDQEAAMAQGINVGRVFAIAWALGVALVALGGIVFGMAPFPPSGNVSNEIHPILAFRVLPVIVLGGLDSVNGAIYGGLIIASAEIFAGEYLSQWNGTLGSGYSTIVPYVVMLVILFVRPYGLFGTPEIRRV